METMKLASHRLALAIFVYPLACLVLQGVARGDVGLVLNSSMGTGSSWVTSGGHASIYLSRVCPVSAVEVRLCAPGEQGSVLSNYSNFHEDKPYEWNIIPVSDFLYGVDDATERPLFATPGLQAELREHYRANHLQALCATEDCKTNPDANWADMVGATFLRTVYIFEVKTTEAQDQALIQWLNSSANVNHYHGLSNNCADFAREVLNRYFPNAIQGHRFADFYITSPKSTARSLTHFGEHHKDLEVRVTRFAQLPSGIRRSDPARSGMETVFTSKKSLLPMLLRPEELGFIAGSYLLTDRFSAERAARRHSPDEKLEDLQLADLGIKSLAGKPEGWAEYRAAMKKQVGEARELGVIENDGELARTFREIQRNGKASLDEEGRPRMQVQAGVVGLTVSDVEKSPDEDAARLAYKFQLARVRFYLHSHGMDREALPEFQQDWALLQMARTSYLKGQYRGPVSVTAQNKPVTTSGPTASEARGR
jgi:hypothetical protein